MVYGRDTRLWSGTLEIWVTSRLSDLTDEQQWTVAIDIVPVKEVGSTNGSTVLTRFVVVGFSLIPGGEGRWWLWRGPHKGTFLCNVVQPQPHEFIPATGDIEQEGRDEVADFLWVHLEQFSWDGFTNTLWAVFKTVKCVQQTVIVLLCSLKCYSL